MLVRADGTRLVTTTKDALALHLPSTDSWATIAGDKDDEDEGFKDGQGTDACFSSPGRITVDHGVNIVLTDYLRKVSKARAPS